MVNNVDVTLRDGGYLNNFNFTTEYAIKHVEALTKSGVEWSEIGYRNGSFKPISSTTAVLTFFNRKDTHRKA
ncbi:hypothetical protein LGZ99_18830 [Photorhabdus temperata]|uniref:Uncharacterized protein n=1 Tax=Photorhabdus temperata subsp. temperata Meg1 TaxID=1393735 RepID=A0A081RZS0_PHOTE|nr:hypothetical protein [Photorhabdus temperata]KER04173.1 hypothetical protein MEG1DRAFT_01144 [Photorhabdus temperata subsp. temperata Meg1]MCT8349186.1 hypothetical protein [Photorhabdus temperata]